MPRPKTPTDVQVDDFKSIDQEDLIALAPSWREGLDLKDDLARFCIVAKIPYRYWGDPFVRARAMRPNGGRKWYDADACVAVVQGAGRVVRSPEDFGTTFIVDKAWTRVKRYAPSWFKPISLAIEP